VGDLTARLLPVLLGLSHGRLGMNKEINCEEILFSIRATEDIKIPKPYRITIAHK